MTNTTRNTINQPIQDDWGVMQGFIGTVPEDAFTIQNLDDKTHTKIITLDFSTMPDWMALIITDDTTGAQITIHPKDISLIMPNQLYAWTHDTDITVTFITTKLNTDNNDGDTMNKAMARITSVLTQWFNTGLLEIARTTSCPDTNRTQHLTTEIPISNPQSINIEDNDLTDSELMDNYEHAMSEAATIVRAHKNDYVHQLA